MCKEPVTFGGGITIVKGGFEDVASALKYPAATHFSYRGGSISAGEKLEANSRDMRSSLDYALFSS
jgi:hypothetical protein